MMGSRCWDEILEDVPLVSTLDELFTLWREAHESEDDCMETTLCPGVEQASFVADGYICKDSYESSPTRILFILKEANVLHDVDPKPAAERSQYGYYQAYLSAGKDNRPKQLEKMGRMACYILNKAENPTDAEIKAALKQSAFMNLNKRGGGAAADNTKLDAYRCKYAAFIKKQIELLNPQVIICLGTHKGALACEPRIEKEGLIPALDMYHTAPIGKREMAVPAYMQLFVERYCSREQPKSYWSCKT